jgi:hypothetical protein
MNQTYLNRSAATATGGGTGHAAYSYGQNAAPSAHFDVNFNRSFFGDFDMSTMAPASFYHEQMPASASFGQQQQQYAASQPTRSQYQPTSYTQHAEPYQHYQSNGSGYFNMSNAFSTGDLINYQQEYMSGNEKMAFENAGFANYPSMPVNEFNFQPKPSVKRTPTLGMNLEYQQAYAHAAEPVNYPTQSQYKFERAARTMRNHHHHCHQQQQQQQHDQHRYPHYADQYLDTCDSGSRHYRIVENQMDIPTRSFHRSRRY